ncbi:hypothetical protein K474DRAFT_462626 [Panus rudis PR-1116 ss-1]|nr:hypothetical protein K474DRAFT_462626 [Panus rudis PR-1116 ss-1]
MSLSRLFANLADHPKVTAALTFDSLLTFVSITSYLKQHIAWRSAASLTGPPALLPSDVVELLGRVLGISPRVYELLEECWEALKELVWPLSSDTWQGSKSRSEGLFDIFLRHGLDAKIGFLDLYPPVRRCMDPECAGHHFGETRELSDLRSIRVTVFTQAWGPVPSWLYSAACKGCKTRYYPTYYVHHQRSLRTHYLGAVPPFIHVTMHTLIETTLCERFRLSMTCAWVSATNNARIYSREHSDKPRTFPRAWPAPSVLSCDLVWDAFFLYTLLEWKANAPKPTQLVLDHDHQQAARLLGAIQDRNMAMSGHGQPHWNHACDLCCHIGKNEDGKEYAVRAVVMDGVSIGRPCCGEHDCKNPLPNQRARFCDDHKHLYNICSVVGCNAEVDIRKNLFFLIYPI